MGEPGVLAPPHTPGGLGHWGNELDFGTQCGQKQVFLEFKSFGVPSSKLSLAPASCGVRALGMLLNLWETRFLHLNPENNHTHGCEN